MMKIRTKHAPSALPENPPSGPVWANPFDLRPQNIYRALTSEIGEIRGDLS